MHPKILKKTEYFQFIDDLQPESMTTLVVLDIDNFKNHIENKLKESSQSILTIFADIFPGVVSQVGRDAYSCLIQNDISIFELADLKRILQKKISAQLNIDLTFCMGISHFPGTGKNTQELFALAYEALFLAKKTGENSIKVYQDEPMKLKSLYFRKSQLEKLSVYAKNAQQNESFIIRRALDDYIRKYIT